MTHLAGEHPMYACLKEIYFPHRIFQVEHLRSQPWSKFRLIEQNSALKLKK